MRFTCPRCNHAEDIPPPAPAACPSCGFTLASGLTIDGTLSYDPNATRPYQGRLAARPQVRDAVGGYRLLREIGAGGMGAVYEAEEAATGRRVALKLIRPELAASPGAVARLRREGRLAATVTHPRCVFVLTADEDDGLPYVVMELMPGETLQDLVERASPLAPQDAISRIVDVIDGLEALHRRGIVHRDVKPGNCFLEADGRVKVGDFGLAFSLVAERDPRERGRFAGTPLFASPEQHRGEPLDARTDVYSVSATLYFLLTGRPPFEGRDTESLLKRIVSGPAPPMRTLRPDLPPGLDRVVLRGLERDPGRRWQTLDALRRALLRFGPARLSSVGLRLRVAAYLIDFVAVTAEAFVLGTPLVLLLRLWLPSLDLNPLPIPQYNVCSGLVDYAPANALLAAAVEYLYFGVFEGVFGCGLGKWLMGLRVVAVAGDRPPGIPRALARATVFCLLMYLPRYLLYLIHAPCFIGVLCGLMSWWNLGSVLLIASTMRQRNGYRALHDFITGTCVVNVAATGREIRTTWLRRPCPDRLAEPLFAPDGLPEAIGPFAVRGVLARRPGGGVALAEDTALGRNVVLWVRPAAEPPLPPRRREASRLTRLRWLAEGVEGPARWDAFVAEEGRPLTDLTAEGGKFPWEAARAILHPLADELAAACAEGTVPRPLVPLQVWVRPDGGVFLFDLPPEGSEDYVEPVTLSDDRRALSLLGEVAVLALEGKGRPAGQSAVPVRAPLPLYAVEMLARLIGADRPYGTVEEFRADLTATQDRPARLPRMRRAAQVLVQGAIAAIAIVLAIGAGELVGNTARIGSDLEEVFFWAAPIGGLIWSTLSRGGPSFFACGVALVRADGRRAARWQALLRSFLAWVEGGIFLFLIPYGVGMVLVGVLESRYGPEVLHSEAVNNVLLYSWIGWIVVYTVLVVWLPRRRIIDRIARTYLVPR